MGQAEEIFEEVEVDLEEVWPREEARTTPAFALTALKGNALVLFAHGEGMVLLWSAHPVVAEMIRDNAMTEATFALAGSGIYCTAHPDGLYVGTLRIEDDGPGDWPGAREASVCLSDLRPATAAEWQAHREGDVPWKWDGHDTPWRRLAQEKK